MFYKKDSYKTFKAQHLKKFYTGFSLINPIYHTQKAIKILVILHTYNKYTELSLKSSRSNGSRNPAGLSMHPSSTLRSTLEWVPEFPQGISLELLPR